MDLASKPSIVMASGSSSSFHYQWVHRTLLEQGLSNNSSFLDVGAGNGNLLTHLREQGFHKLSGIDALPAPGALEADWVQTDLNKEFALKLNKKFDCVLCVEVIEHLENPRNLFRQMDRLLAPNGLLLLTTPNVESIRSILSLVVRGHYVDFLDNSYPAHISPMVGKDLKRMGQEMGFQNLELRYSDSGHIPGWTSMKWQELPALGPYLRGRLFSDHQLLIGKKT